jgi:hypothetical protein
LYDGDSDKNEIRTYPTIDEEITGMSPLFMSFGTVA